MMIKQMIKFVSVYTLLLLAALIFTAVQYKIKTFGDIGLDEILFYVFNGMGGANISNFSATVINHIPLFLLTFIILIIPTIDLYRNRLHLKIQTGRRSTSLNISKVIRKTTVAYAVLVFIIFTAYGLLKIDAYNYVVAKNSTSSFFEDNYTDPQSVELDFPDKKRNLIYIFLESMENTVASEANGGSAETSFIPELESLALDEDNTSFSNTDKLGGPLPLEGTTWTVGGMVSQSAGIPVLTTSRIDGNSFGQLDKFMPGAYSLGDVLEKEGYYQELLIGSEAQFGGRDKYYTQHGNYEIFDLNTAREKGKISQDYHVWWGYEDKKLFQYAKEELIRISQLDKPFNFQMLTVDTHHIDGYYDPSCGADRFAAQYDNVYSCASKRTAELVSWIQKQKFYDNTTVVIAGDHLGMQHDYFNSFSMDKPYQRTLYNVYINAVENSNNNTKGRLFSTFDMYPTTLASMGVNINGNKLGLGVNLYSGEKTIIEKNSFEYVNKELVKKSPFYYENILSKRQK